MVKKETNVTHAADQSDLSEFLEEEDIEDEFEMDNLGSESDNSDSDELEEDGSPKKKETRKHFKAKTLRLKKTDEGRNLKIARVKIEDRKFDGTSVKQKHVINYMSAVLFSRHVFYSEMWKDMSNILMDCVLNMPKWSRPSKTSSNIEQWLGTSSIGFCVRQSTFFESKRLPKPKKESKPIGRPRKSDAQLKNGRRRYALKNRDDDPGDIVMDVEEPSELENSATTTANPSTSNGAELSATKIERVPIFKARSYRFSVRNMDYGGMESGLRVDDLAAELSRVFPNTKLEENIDGGECVYSSLPKYFFDGLKSRRGKPSFFQALFCGGPISAMAACPRRSSAGDEIVAVSTFPDEKLLTSLDNSAHVQFWSFPSDLGSEAKLKFILEIPNVSSVLSLCWCPCFTHEFFSLSLQAGPGRRSAQQKQMAKETERIFKNYSQTEEILGFLAVGTNVGKIFIYCIPRNIDDLSVAQSPSSTSSAAPPAQKRARRSSVNSAAKEATRKKAENNGVEHGKNDAFPRILTTEPKIVLEHPTATMRIDEGNQEIFFKKVPKPGKYADGPSASVSQYFENLLNTAVSFKDLCEFPIISMSWSPFRNGRKIAAVSAAGRVLVWDIEAKAPFNEPLIIHSPTWNSPPMSVSWFSASDICISFRLKCARVYNVETESCTFQEDAAKTAGQFVYASPAVFPGFFTYDTSFLPFYDIFFSCSSYMAFTDDNHKKALVIPLFNNHQIQVARMNVCELSGCVASVGLDGRLHSTLNGRILPHRGESLSKFMMGRTHMHILPHSVEESVDEIILHRDETAGNGVTPVKPPPKKSKRKSNAKTSSVTNGTKSNGNGTNAEEANQLSNALDTIQQNLVQIKREIAMGGALATVTEPESPELLLESENIPSTSVAQPPPDTSKMMPPHEEEPVKKLCFSHTDCCENKWLEIRVGDAAMKDQITLRRVKSKVPEVCLDRRMESLSTVEYSRITPCLSMSGGEAGLLFLMPCIL